MKKGALSKSFLLLFQLNHRYQTFRLFRCCEDLKVWKERTTGPIMLGTCDLFHATVSGFTARKVVSCCFHELPGRSAKGVCFLNQKFSGQKQPPVLSANKSLQPKLSTPQEEYGKMFDGCFFDLHLPGYQLRTFIANPFLHQRRHWLRSLSSHKLSRLTRPRSTPGTYFSPEPEHVMAVES